MHFSEPKRIHDLVVKSREIALSQALSTAARWISNKAIHGANQGSMNVHSVYGNVLRHLVDTSASPAETTDEVDIPSLLKRLSLIESKTAELTRHELATSLSMTEFRRALDARTKAKQRLAADLVKPYIESLEGRLDAVDPIYQLLNRFLKIVNGMLSDKELHYTLSSGFKIENRLGGILQPSQLSSGEQQLLLLFCYVLTARDNPSVFMIDEPEISLNVKWQRLLIQSLLDITRDSSIQFIFASHSMELLAQHKSRVVKLVNDNEQ
jgi:AAA domain, putative AbiEii toxin, Type IV TA system